MRRFVLFLALSTIAYAEDAILARVAAHADHFGAVSRQIWETPELGFHEQRSSTLLRDELTRAGFSIDSGVGGMPTAFTATWGSGKPVIAVLGEFDALPGLSQKDAPKQDPVLPGAPGHGCGHNLLGSGSALAVVAIKEEMQARGLKGTIRYYGTPAEEGGGGKIFMLHAGLFRDVEVVLAWHPSSANSVSLRSTVALNYAKFRFHGVAAHAATPEKGRSALDGVLVMVTAVEFLRHHVPANSQIHYVISNGGATPSVVPAFAEVNLGANHPDALILDEIWKRILKCAQAGALATETRVEVEQGQNYSNILPNDALTALVGRNMRKVGGYEYNNQEKQFAEELKKTLSASAALPNPDVVSIDLSEGSAPYASDVGDVSWNLPTVNFFAATFVSGTVAHSWQAAACAGSSIGRKGMLVAARTLALSAIDLLEHPAEIDAAKASFEKRRGERRWITLIPPDAKPPLDYAGN